MLSVLVESTFNNLVYSRIAILFLTRFQGSEPRIKNNLMAQRRMFSKSISNSSQFLMMPNSSQNLYFHLGMNADDDGFCEHFTIMRMTESKPDDLKILQAKGFVNVFDDRVLVITDWKENNYLRSDRYTPSKYLEVYKDEIKRLSSGIPEVAIGKDRLGKVREVEERSPVGDAFNTFWLAYPKKELKKKAQDKWKAKKLDSKIDQILTFIDEAKKTDRWKKGFIKAPPVFLGNECWNDDLAGYNDKYNSRAKSIAVIN